MCVVCVCGVCVCGVCVCVCVCVCGVCVCVVCVFCVWCVFVCFVCLCVVCVCVFCVCVVRVCGVCGACVVCVVCVICGVCFVCVCGVCVCVCLANHFVLQGATDAFQAVYVHVCCNIILRLDDLLHTPQSPCLSRAGHTVIFQFLGDLGPLNFTCRDVIHIDPPPSRPSAKNGVRR